MHHKGKAITFADQVDKAVRFGQIDSNGRVLDEWRIGGQVISLNLRG